jgi:hypothetical protein
MTKFNESATGALAPSSFSPIVLGKVWETMAAKIEGLDNATAAAITARNDGVQMVMDSMRAAQKSKMAVFLAGNAVSNQAKRDIADMFAGFAADGLMKKNTATMYASSYWLCYEEGIAFNPMQRKIKAAEKADGVTVETANAKITSIETLEKALIKALAMARVLQHTTAGGLLDLILEVNPKFTEAEAK